MAWETGVRKLEAKICGGARRGRSEQVARLPRCEVERVVSCCGGYRWWRTKLDVGSGESLDDHHRRTKLGQQRNSWKSGADETWGPAGDGCAVPSK